MCFFAFIAFSIVLSLGDGINSIRLSNSMTIGHIGFELLQSQASVLECTAADGQGALIGNIDLAIKGAIVNIDDTLSSGIAIKIQIGFDDLSTCFKSTAVNIDGTAGREDIQAIILACKGTAVDISSSSEIADRYIDAIMVIIASLRKGTVVNVNRTACSCHAAAHVGK